MKDNLNYLHTLTEAIPQADHFVRGGPDRWAATVAIINAKAGFGEEVWDLDQRETLLAWTVSGGAVISEVPGFRGATTHPHDFKVNLQPPGCSSRYRTNGPVTFGQFYIPDGLLSRVATGLNIPHFSSACLRHDLIMFEDRTLHELLATYAARASDTREIPSRLEMEARAILIAERLVNVYHRGRGISMIRGGLSPGQMKRCLEVMEENLSSDMSLDFLASVAGCSPTHFSRAFKQSLGIPPSQWVLEKRITRAKAMLTQSNLPLAEIALSVGFSAQPQFTTAFRRVVGTTPGAWRREHRM